MNEELWCHVVSDDVTEALTCSLNTELECNLFASFQNHVTYSTYEPPHDKTNKMTVRPAKIHISLGILPV